MASEHSSSVSQSSNSSLNPSPVPHTHEQASQDGLQRLSAENAVSPPYPLIANRPVRIALVGCGVISHDHVRAFADAGGNRERSRLVAFCDTHIESAHATYSTYATALNANVTAPVTAEAAPGAQAVYSTPNIPIETQPEATTNETYAEILARPDVDAVDLCLPHDLHVSRVIQAAEAGKHILCEKPLAMTIADCTRMIDAAQANDILLMHGENLRLAANIERAAELVRQGAVGKVVGIQGTFAYWQRAHMNEGWRGKTREAGGGMLIDGGIHLVDAMRHVGGDVLSVQAMTGVFRQDTGDGEDLAVINLRYAGGYLGQIFACHSTQGRGSAPLLTVYGTEGILNLDSYQSPSLLVFQPGKPAGENLQAESLPSSWQASFVREVTHFLDVLQHGIPLRARPEDGRANLALVLAAYESARTGREIALS